MGMDNDFDWNDATLLGGIMGFAEESMREEDSVPEDVEYPIVDFQEPENADDTIIRLFRNGHPREFEWLVKKIIQQRLEWAEDERKRLEDADESRFLDEVDAIERSLYDENIA